MGGDRGFMSGAGDGDDSSVGGRSTAASDRTMIRGNVGNDTIVSGLGNDEIFGDAGSNMLAYASIEQDGLDIVNRGTNGVTAYLAERGPGPRRAAGAGGAERDIIHSDFGTLVGSNGNDVLIGNDAFNQIVGVAPAGTAGREARSGGQRCAPRPRRCRSAPDRRRGQRLGASARRRQRHPARASAATTTSSATPAVDIFNAGRATT